MRTRPLLASRTAGRQRAGVRVAQFVYPSGQSTGIIGASFKQRTGDLFLVPRAQRLEDDAHTQGRRDLGECAEGRIDVAG